MALDGVKLEFDHAAIEAIADKALEMEIGARGLRSILEKIMTDIMFRVPSDKSIKRVIITADCVKDGKPPVALRNDNSDSRSAAFQYFPERCCTLMWSAR